jgi:hypothetical protein
MHWVSGHSVTRASYGDSSSSWRSSTASSGLSGLSVPSRTVGRRYPALPYSARWVKPNARCPVCGAAVYFWSNSNGSRVYFDEMGPPWPEHPCTDARLVGAPGLSRPSSYPSKGTFGAAAHSFDFRRRFATAPPLAYVVERSAWDGQVTFLYARRLGLLPWRTVFRVRYPLPWVPGQLVFVSQKRLSVVHPHTLEVLMFPAEKG